MSRFGRQGVVEPGTEKCVGEIPYQPAGAYRRRKIRQSAGKEIVLTVLSTSQSCLLAEILIDANGVRGVGDRSDPLLRVVTENVRYLSVRDNMRSGSGQRTETAARESRWSESCRRRRRCDIPRCRRLRTESQSGSVVGSKISPAIDRRAVAD